MSEMPDPLLELRGVSSPTELKPQSPVPPRGERPRGATARLAILVGLILALGYFGSLSAVVVVFALIIMIALHELGHFVTAKWAGMKVTEFFIGFGPKIWSFHRGETEYGLKVVPAGAYVRIIGMHNLDPVDPVDEGRTYRQQPYWRRMSVAVAGSTMHFLLALVLLFALFTGYGQQREDNWHIGSISKLVGAEDSPAVKAGLQLGDRVVAINGVSVQTFQDAVDIIRPRPGETITLTVKRGGTTFDTATQLAEHNPDGEAVGFLGIGASFPYVKEGTATALGHTFTDFGSGAVAVVQGLGHLFSPSGISGYVDNVVGSPASNGDTKGGPAPRGGGGDANNDRALSPIGAVRLASQAADAGVPDLLKFLAVINLFIGVFNLVPLLPLDGGHVAIATYERIRSRRGRQYHADVAKLLPLTYAVVAVLGLIFLSSAYLDIFKPVSNPFGK